MDLINKDQSNPYICGILFATKGNISPIKESLLLQSFYDTNVDQIEFEKIYVSKGKLSFSESSKDSRSGTYFEQKISFRLPAGDRYRSLKTVHLQQIKYIVLVLTTGKYLYIGRNDFYQNKPPQISLKTNENQFQLEMTNRTIYPTGYANLENVSGFPYSIPSYE